MARRDDDDDYQPPRQRSAPRSGPIERRIINPRAINTYRSIVIAAMVWDGIVICLVMFGVWTVERGKPSDVWLMSATLFMTIVGIIFAWLFPTGDSE